MSFQDLYQSFEAKVAGFLPGWKTIALAGGVVANNAPDLLQLVLNHVPDIISFVPEPYKTVINVLLPVLMMWTTGLRNRVENRIDTTAPVTAPSN